jgi:lysophospholipase L1-like esterase
MEDKNNSRRSFLKKAVLGSLVAISIPEILAASSPKFKTKHVSLLKGQTILFQGDSITDSGRNKEDTGFNTSRSLGSGYPMLAAASLLERHADLDLKIYNKGISGNKVYQLVDRWETDCFAIKPDILSILIGVNDIWHKLNGTYNGTVEIYRQDYIAMLEMTKRVMPDVKLIIGEPYGVRGIKAVNDNWYPEFYEYQKAAREIAAQFGASFIPYQAIFDEAQKHAPGVYWTADGVHPTLAGAQLMAKAWMDVIK